MSPDSPHTIAALMPTPSGAGREGSWPLHARRLGSRQPSASETPISTHHEDASLARRQANRFQGDASSGIRAPSQSSPGQSRRVCNANAR